MAIGALTGRDMASGSPQVTKVNQLPAPVKGIDARNVLSNKDPLSSIYAYNLTPSYYGLQIRSGTKEWSIDLETAPAAGLGVRTIIPIGGNDEDSSDDALFAVTNEGIWDVTIEAAAPTLVYTFPVQTEGAGAGVFTTYTTDAGTELTFYADALNGLLQYDPTVVDPLLRWTVPAITGTGLVIANVIFVTSHKSRLWIFMRDSTVGYYLNEGSISGAATEFFFGSKFKHGGDLGGLYSWTIDGGIGIDDYFVAVSRAGDVIVYSGTSPTDASTWTSTGQWFIGAVPAGNRFGTQQGGNLYLLSIYGLVSLGDLIQGVDGVDISKLTEAVKIAPLIRQAMLQSRDTPGWAVKYVPAGAALVVTAPPTPTGDYLQFVQSTQNGGWGVYRGVKALDYNEWGSKVYVGFPDSRVMILDADLDDTKITPPATGSNGSAIDFSILTTYGNLGEPSLNKRGKFVRASYVGITPTADTSKLVYDFALGEILNNNPAAGSVFGQWDVGLWDQAIWGSNTPENQQFLAGAGGMGRNVAVATRGTGTRGTYLIEWDVLWDTGGPL